MKQYDFDDPNIPEEYYESDDWVEYEDLLVEQDKPEYYLAHKSKVYQDYNWEALKAERLLAPVEDTTVAKIANCKFQIWLDSQRIGATYDISYKSGRKEFGRRASGSWDKEEAKTTTEFRALDAVTTMIARSHLSSKVKFSRMHEHNSVKDVIREITLIEMEHEGTPLRAWFVVGDIVYPARYNHSHDNRYEWCFNGRKKITIDKFCDMCWDAVK